jgi:O-methyltransferase
MASQTAAHLSAWTKDAVKRVLPAPVRRAIQIVRRAARRHWVGGRVALAEFVLPTRAYVQMLPEIVHRRMRFPDFKPTARRYNRDSSSGHQNTVADGNRVLSLLLLLDGVGRLPRGDYAEVGTWRGYSARIIFMSRSKGAQLHCFDTFEGFDDRDLVGEQRQDRGWCRAGHFADTSLDAVRSYIVGDSTDAEALLLHKGYFPDTFAGLEDRAWRFVHLDADLYAPTCAALERFYPRLVPGGVVIVHDYNSFYFDGARKAVDEFCRPRGIVPVQLPDSAGSVVIIKPAVAAANGGLGD